MKKTIILFLILTIISIPSCGSGNETVPEEKPIEFVEFQWPKSEISSRLPIPESNIGHIDWEASYGFVIYVGETPKEQYDAYVDECWSAGFTVDYRKGDDYFYALDDLGYDLTLKYEGNNTMFVRLDEPKNSNDTSSSIESNAPNSSVSKSVTSSAVSKPKESETLVFAPKDVSDKTIQSISTYNDYLIMYETIILDYFSNYEKTLKGTILYNKESFDELKSTCTETFKEQENIYGEMGNSKLVGKDTLVKFLINYRDSLSASVDNLKSALQ